MKLVIFAACLLSTAALAQEKPSYETVLEQKVQAELNAELNCSIRVLDQQRALEALQKKINELEAKK